MRSQTAALDLIKNLSAARISAARISAVLGLRGSGTSRPVRSRLRRLSMQSLENRRLMVAEGAAFNLNETLSFAGLVGDVSAQVDWGDGFTTAATTTAGDTSGNLRVNFNFSRDTNQFFNQPGARAALEYAAESFVGRFSDQFTAIGTNQYVTVTPQILDPATGQLLSLPNNPTIPANTVVIYAGARNLAGDTAGLGGPGGFGLQSSFQFSSQQERERIENEIDQFNNNVLGRGQAGALGTASTATDYAVAIGSITFDRRGTRDWYFGIDPAGIRPGQTDFITVATHELAHVFGFGTANSWMRLSSSSGFQGAAARAVHPGSGNVPLQADSPGNYTHWAQSVDDTIPTIMSARIDASRRDRFSELDFAAMDDIGYDIVDLDATITATHRYADNGTFPNRVILTDASGGTLEFSVGSATVTNVAPTLAVAPDQRIVVGQAVSITDIGAISDPGFRNLNSDPATSETFSYTIDWGDGQTDSGTATIDRQGRANVTTLASFNGNHTYESTGTRTVRVSVQDDDGGSATGTFRITVDPQPELSLSVASAVITENDGANATMLTVSSSVPAPSGGLRVNLTSSDPSEATVAATATIPAGASSITIPINAVDDTLLDGAVPVTFTAATTGFASATTAISVNDAEQITTTFSSSSVREGSSGAVTLTIRRSNTDVAQPIEVRVGGQRALVGVASRVTIAAGQRELRLALAPPDDSNPEPTESLRVSFAADGYQGSTSSIDLLDDEAALLQNQQNRFDVDGLQGVTALDALLIINAISRRTSEQVDPATEVPNGNLVDVNGDYRVTALDALEVINEIARQAAENESTSVGSVALLSQQAFSPQPIVLIVNPGDSGDDDESAQRSTDAAILAMF